MIILASASPRRVELLGGVFDSFEIRPSDAEEKVLPSRPSATVMLNAKAKAEAVRAERSDTVIAADTVVYMDGEYYLKPATLAEAARMLKKLSGRKHNVYTGVCIKTGGQTHLFYDKSAVYFKKLTDDDIANYCSDKKPIGKAGAYGIQDNFVVKKYSGSYTNIVGLPMEMLLDKLKDLGL